MTKIQEIREKLSAANALLAETATTREKLASLTSLLTGVHPKTDKILRELNKQLTALGNIEKGDLIQLSADNLPENTDQDKKRKRLLLLLIKTWKDLQSEVVRVQGEFEKAEQTGGQDVTMWGRIFSAAKGPLAIATVIAIGAAALHTTAVRITIENDGCGTIQSASSVPVSIPGLKLPNEPITSGESAIATIPPLTLTIDGTAPGALAITSLGFSLSIELGNGIEGVTFDNESLLNKQTTIELSESKEHTLVISCR